MFVKSLTSLKKVPVSLIAVGIVLGLGYFANKVVAEDYLINPPGTPVLQIVSGTPSSVQVQVTWTEPTATGTTVQGYKVFRSVDGGTAQQIASGDVSTFSTSGTAISYVDTLTPTSSKYSYCVQAYDSLGNASALSNVSTTYVQGPTVVNSNPQTGAGNVSVKPVLQVTFDQEIDPLSLNPSTVKIKLDGGNYLTGTNVTYDHTQKSATLFIQGTLNPKTKYSWEITSGVKNTSQLSVANNLTFTFTTANSSNYPHGDYSLTTAECSKCHLSHTAAGKKLIVSTANNSDANELCFVCHNGVQANDFFGKDSYNTNAHPISSTQKTECNACHTPHGSANPKLLTGPYDLGPSTTNMTYSPANQFFCVNASCHVAFSNLAASSSTSFRNPVSPTATTNTGIDLHYLHLIKAGQDNKGNALCYDCHRPHGPVAAEIEGSTQTPALLGAVHLVGFPSTATVTPALGNPNPTFGLNPIVDQTGGGCTLTCHGVTHVDSTAVSGETDSRYDNTPTATAP